ncbi:uncharacterized protein JCM10292_004619 [Rhodotorula paludigena]|uniref:uncharacterized protein n=1 Tax=Rhodotorula paludigena TaxID=86838 RepID=UPI00317CDB1A
MSASTAVRTDDGKKGGAPIHSSAPAPKLAHLALKKLTIAAALLIVVFFGAALWLYGSLWHNSTRTHNLGVAVVDFDSASVGSALLAAVQTVNGRPNAPTFHVLDASSVSQDEVLDKVFDGTYWGAIVATASATDRFEGALASDAAAQSYNASQALLYAGLEVRYATAWSGFVLPSLQQVIQTTNGIFRQQVVAPLLASETAYSGAVIDVMLSPVSSTYANLTPFPQGTKAVLNTVGMVFPFLYQFFFILMLNGLFLALGVYKGMSLRRHVKYRLAIGTIWTILTSLTIVAWALMFSEDYRSTLPAKNFFALWTVVWVFCMIILDTFDTLTTWIPPQFVPYCTIVIIMTSITAVIMPIELSNDFFRISYAFPSHATWSIMITCLGNGAVNTLKRDAPILMAWLIVGKLAVFFSLRRRAQQGVALAEVKNSPPKAPEQADGDNVVVGKVGV